MLARTENSYVNAGAMKMNSNFRIGLLGIAMFGALGAYGAALAQSPSLAASPSAINATEGATTGLGDSHRFATPAAAIAHCSNDTIVWSSGPALTYILPNAAGYGKGSGFYACKTEADDAGFHPAN
jgi:hypothetical protein